MRPAILKGAIVASLIATPLSVSAETPEQNLDCAVWAAAMTGRADEEKKVGFGFVMAWFIGLYEGATDKEIDAAFNARAQTLTEEQLKAFDPVCLERMSQFGTRLGHLGGEAPPPSN